MPTYQGTAPSESLLSFCVPRNLSSFYSRETEAIKEASRARPTHTSSEALDSP